MKPDAAPVYCAWCAMAYPKGSKPACPAGSKGPEGYSNEMLAFMRCTAAKESKP